MCKSEHIFCVALRVRPQNSVSSLFRNSTLETVFRRFPTDPHLEESTGRLEGASHGTLHVAFPPPKILVHHKRCNAQRSDAQRKFFISQFIPPFLQLHRCDALLCFSASPVIIFYIAHIAFPPLLPFFLSPQWLTVQDNKKFTKSHNAAMSPLATRDGHRKRKRKRSDAVH